jgi:hypothetical protein
MDAGGGAARRSAGGSTRGRTAPGESDGDEQATAGRGPPERPAPHDHHRVAPAGTARQAAREARFAHVAARGERKQQKQSWDRDQRVGADARRALCEREEQCESGQDEQQAAVAGGHVRPGYGQNLSAS